MTRLNSAEFSSFQIKERQWETRFTFRRKKKIVLYFSMHYLEMTLSSGFSVTYSNRTYSCKFEMVNRNEVAYSLSPYPPVFPLGTNLSPSNRYPSKLNNWYTFVLRSEIAARGSISTYLAWVIVDRSPPGGFDFKSWQILASLLRRRFESVVVDFIASSSWEFRK